MIFKENGALSHMEKAQEAIFLIVLAAMEVYP